MSTAPGKNPPVTSGFEYRLPSVTSGLRSIALAMVAVCALYTAAPLNVFADELVVDNTAPFVQVTGPWVTTSLTDGFNGPDYLYRPAGAGSATVFWPFQGSLAPGSYDVFARWTSGANRATNAQYFVSSEAGTSVVTRNQQENGGSWQSLGTFDFKTGKGEGITLSDRGDGVVVADAIRFVAAGEAQAQPPAQPNPQPAPPPAQPAQPASPPAQPAPPAPPASDPNATWTVTLDNTQLRAGPDTGTDVLARIPQFSYLQILGYSGDWAYVYNPRARGTAYAPSAMLGPSDPPPAWVTASPPAAAASVEMMGRTVGPADVAFYPIADKFAYVSRLGHNLPIMVHDRVQAPDGSTWYRVDQGYLSASAIRLPRTPARTFAGRWIDADLSEPAMVTAYDGSRIVMSTLAIKGSVANQTPTGVFSIGRRVEDETMDSGTLFPPIDPHGPGGYHLEHVLYTQYFTADGASLHYNYWSSNFGYSGSHGCLGLTKEDSQFLWTWAGIGTTVSIHQ